MELIESYVQEVGQFLPEEVRHDVCQDLRSTIAEEVYARADEADREPLREDQVEVLRRFGHPLKVASQYQPPRYVIGPDLYPVYLQTLKVIMVIGLAVQVIGFLVYGLAQDWSFGVIELGFKSLEMFFWLFAIVTSVFVILEYSGEKLNLYEQWKPEKLSGRTIGVINRQDVITNLLGEGFFLLWWNDVLVVSNWLPIVGQYLTPDPVWDEYFWHLNVLFGAAFGLHVYLLVRGVWEHFQLVGEIVINVALLAIGFVLVSAGQLVAVSDPEIASNISGFIQTTVRWVIVIIMGFTIWDIWLAFKMLRNKLAFGSQDEGAAA